MGPPTERRDIRFGLFELNVGTGELLKNGRRIPVERQPSLILALLLEHPGEVVGRDQLRSALWANGTFVDFDRGLNVAVKKLRDALGDSSDNPRFIETLSRRGYRFIAPVHPAEPDASRIRRSSCGRLALVPLQPVSTYSPALFQPRLEM